MLVNTSGHQLGVANKVRDGSLLSEVMSELTPKISKTASTQPSNEALVAKLAKDTGINLVRVAGNVYEHPATRDFWAVRSGKLVRLTSSTEVDDNESLDPANVDDPESTLHSILADLEF